MNKNIKKRLSVLQKNMKLNDLEGLVITNPLNIKYLLNLDAEGTILISSCIYFLTDKRYLFEVEEKLEENKDIKILDVSKMTKQDFEKIFKKSKRVGFEEEHLTYSKYLANIERYNIKEFVQTNNIIEKQRMIKEDEEIENIKIACSITDDCFKYICSYIKPGMSEIQIADEIESFYSNSKADKNLAFDTIVASGKNTAIPHATPGNRIIKKQDIILIDMGCKYKGYASDMTRTIFVGSIDEENKKVYDLVLENLEKVEIELKSDVDIKNISKIVEESFSENGYEISHALGHGLGLYIHELPVISTKYEGNFNENMVVAIEPGIYLKDKFGIRIEDTVVITKKGCIKLSKSDKNYIIIKS